MSNRIDPGYHLAVAPADQKVIVNQLVKKVRKFKKTTNFSHIAVMGVSGQSVAWPISYLTGIPILVVRKQNEKSAYSTDTIIGSGKVQTYIIVDDLIESGNTVDAIVKEITKQFDNTAQCVGIFLYNKYARHQKMHKSIPIYA